MFGDCLYLANNKKFPRLSCKIAETELLDKPSSIERCSNWMSSAWGNRIAGVIKRIQIIFNLLIKVLPSQTKSNLLFFVTLQ